MTPAAPADLPGLLGPARLLARRYARRHRLDPDQCDSEACWALLAAYRCYDPERRGYEARGTTLRTWALGRVHFALRSLRRAALGTRRKRPVRVFATAHLAEHGAHDPPPAWAEDEAARHLLRGLTPPERHALWRRVVDGATGAQVAREMGLDRSRVTQLTCDAARFLRYAGRGR
jgi:DNA-directed RNA polymerase specialized sigma24 family protein